MPARLSPTTATKNVGAGRSAKGVAGCEAGRAWDEGGDLSYLSDRSYLSCSGAAARGLGRRAEWLWTGAGGAAWRGAKSDPKKSENSFWAAAGVGENASADKIRTSIAQGAKRARKKPA
jgi:hypothetical protein